MMTESVRFIFVARLFTTIVEICCRKSAYPSWLGSEAHFHLHASAYLCEQSSFGVVLFVGPGVLFVCCYFKYRSCQYRGIDMMLRLQAHTLLIVKSVSLPHVCTLQQYCTQSAIS